MTSLLRQVQSIRASQMDQVVVNAMKDNNITVNSSTYNTIVGATQHFMVSNYEAAAQTLREGGFKKPSQLHTMISYIAMKKHQCSNDGEYGSKYQR